MIELVAPALRIFAYAAAATGIGIIIGIKLHGPCKPLAKENLWRYK